MAQSLAHTYNWPKGPGHPSVLLRADLQAYPVAFGLLSPTTFQDVK